MAPAPSTLPELASDYQRIASAIAFLQARYQLQPDLADLAAHLHLSEHHLQRLFARWAGVSPKRFVQFLTKEHAKALLRHCNVLDTSLALGLSGSSRLHDLMVTTEAVTPGEYASAGQGLRMAFGFCATPFGHALVASTPRGLCQLDFFDAEVEREAQVQALQSEWPHAVLVRDDTQAQAWAARIFAPRLSTDTRPLHVLLKGSNFQLQVWQALLRIPAGQVMAYGDLAQAIGRPAAARAVGTAVASNRIGYLIPCHRVIRQGGHFHHYRWGPARKQAMLARESALGEADIQVL